jgi:hypothetical protein
MARRPERRARTPPIEQTQPAQNAIGVRERIVRPALVEM